MFSQVTAKASAANTAVLGSGIVPTLVTRKPKSKKSADGTLAFDKAEIDADEAPGPEPQLPPRVP
jgi:hypothetical protein